jgi:AraC-like DNA-binding protein
VQQRARLVDATRGRAELRVVESFDQLRRALRSTIDDVDVVVLPPRDSAGSDAVHLIRELVVERPRVALVAYCHAGSQYSTDLRALAAAGVHQFVFNGIDDSGVAFRAVLDAARRNCGAEWVMRQLAPVIPASLHPMVEATLAAPDVVTNLPTLAAVLHVHRKTLFNRCERADFLAPAELVAWVRLALVAYLLATTGCSIETIAMELAYPSDTSLRNAMKRYTGFRGGEIRERGGVDAVVRALRKRLTDTNHAGTALHLV